MIYAVHAITEVFQIILYCPCLYKIRITPRRMWMEVPYFGLLDMQFCRGCLTPACTWTFISLTDALTPPLYLPTPSHTQNVDGHNRYGGNQSPI